MQEDWAAKLHLLRSADLKGKTVALFGLGDQSGHPDSFLDAMGTLYDLLVEGGDTPVGSWPADGYGFVRSTALRDGMFVGLALDEDRQAGKTRERIEAWLGQLAEH
jgi:flavodoxin I